MPYDVLVSTIPLYALLSLAGVPEPSDKLQFKPIYVSSSSALPMGGMYVNYISSPDTPVYRVTWRDAAMHQESLQSTDGVTIKITPGKIYAHPAVPSVRHLLAAYGIWTFGRFASWNPDELAHETYRQAKAFGEQHGL